MKNRNRVIAIIQARFSSTRLPGKVLMKIGNKSLLGWAVERAINTPSIDKVVVATSTLPEDDVVRDEANLYGADVVRGSIDNVLQRFCMAIKKFEPEHVVRLTADNPLLDEKGLELMIKSHIKEQSDYTNLGGGIPIGAGGEIIRSTALETACSESRDKYDQEHVTSYIYRNQGQFVCGKCEPPGYLRHNAGIRLTVDTKEDLQLLLRIEELLSLREKKFDAESALELISENKSLTEINKHVPQKKRLV